MAASPSGLLWVADRARREVIAVDPATTRIVHRYRTGTTEPLGVAAGRTSVWFLDYWGGRVVRIDPLETSPGG